MVGVVLGETKPSVAIELCCRDFLMEHVTIVSNNIVEKYMIVLKEKDYELLVEKTVKLIRRDDSRVVSANESASEFNTFHQRGRRANTVVVHKDIDFGVISHGAFNDVSFVRRFIAYVKEKKLTELLFSTPVMTMNGYFLSYGISVQHLKMYLAGYAFYSGAEVFAREIFSNGLLSDNHVDRAFSLLYSAHANNWKMCKFLLSHGTEVTADVIYVAVHKPNVESLKTLLEASNTNINDVGNIVNGNTPLMVAARKGKTEVVKCLLEHGADQSLTNCSKMTALHLSVLYKRYEVIQLLVNKGNSPINEKGGKFKRTPLHIAADIGNDKSVKIMLNHGANVRLKDHRGHYAIHLAAIKGNCLVVETLLQHDQTQDQLRISSYGKKSSIKGMSLYHIAVWKNNEQLLQVLSNLKANPNIKDFYGQTPFVYAILKNRKKCALALAKMEAVDKTLPQKQGFTPLHSAVQTGFLKLVKQIGSSSNANSKDKFGRTPLHVACEKGNIRMVHFLISNCRADPGMVTNRGDTVYHILRRKRNNKGDDHINRRAIEMYLNRVDPRVRERLSTIHNRLGVVISNKELVLTLPDRKKIDEILTKGTHISEDDEDSESEEPPKKIPKIDNSSDTGSNYGDYDDDNSDDSNTADEDEETSDSNEQNSFSRLGYRLDEYNEDNICSDDENDYDCDDDGFDYEDPEIDWIDNGDESSDSSY